MAPTSRCPNSVEAFTFPNWQGGVVALRHMDPHPKPRTWRVSGPEPCNSVAAWPFACGELQRKLPGYVVASAGIFENNALN